MLAWSLWGIWAALAVLTFVLAWDLPTSGDSPVAFLATVGYATVGALVATRQPRNAIGWLLLAIAVTLALDFACEAYVSRNSNPGYVTVAWVSEPLFHVWFYLTLVFLPLLFPTGRVLSAGWRVVWWFDLVCLGGGVLVAGLTPGELDSARSAENPLGVQGVARTVVEAVSQLAVPTYAIALLLTVVSIVVRFRRSIGGERQQLKWFVSAILMALGGLVVAAFGENLSTQWGQALSDLGWPVFFFSCVLGIPLATGFAILRYRLYDIDVVINRTLVYGSLTAALVATYVGSILLLRVLLSPLTGQSDLAVAGSTLVVAAVFRPARAWIQHWVDRRFYRRRYDAAHTIEEFSTRLRHELDLDAVGADLCTTADQTMQPAHVSLWLRQSG